MKRYRTKDGKILSVNEGIGGGLMFMTMFPKPNGVSWKRFVRPELPCRLSREEAQADLDAYAQKHQLEEIEEESDA